MGWTRGCELHTYIAFKSESAKETFLLPNTIDARQTVTGINFTRVIKTHSIELVEGTTQETERCTRILEPVRIEAHRHRTNINVK